MLPVAGRQVVYKAVADGAVLLHTETEVYYGLNRVGARVWELLRQDVTELFDELIGYGLLEVAS